MAASSIAPGPTCAARAISARTRSPTRSSISCSADFTSRRARCRSRTNCWWSSGLRRRSDGLKQSSRLVETGLGEIGPGEEIAVQPKETNSEISRSGMLTVYQAFAARVDWAPDAIAIEQGALKRTYADLNNRVLRLAAAL